MRDAGIGDDDIYPAEARLDMGDQPVRRLGRAHIVKMKLGGATAGKNVVNRLFAFLLEDVGDDDMIAECGKRLGCRLANADACARDDDNSLL